MEVHEPIGGQLELLSRRELDMIHSGTIRVLSRVGIKVWEETALGHFADAGADVDRKQHAVRISEELLKETVGRAPREFTFYGRARGYRLRMGARRVHFSIAGQPVNVHDLDGKVRRATVRDAEDIARLGDACRNIHHISVGTVPGDVPDAVHPHHVMFANWRNSIKTTDGYNYGRAAASETIEMASILRGGTEELRRMPTLLGYVNPVSPLQLSKELIEGALVYAEYGQPVLYAPEALSGGTAPATIAGLLVQQNAEVLAGIMVSQLAHPGTPVLYGTVSAAMDMRTGAAALGGPEVGLINIASAQLARYYGLPCRGTGGNTDSKVVDAQAGAETAQSVLMAGLAGMNFIYDAAGSLDGSLVLSKEKIVLDDEICGMVARILGGVKVTDETLALDEICAVGPSASHLGRAFTAKHFRTEHFIPGLMERGSREAWEKHGMKDIAQQARGKAERVLREHEPEPMDRSVESELREYLTRLTKRHAR